MGSRHPSPRAAAQCQRDSLVPRFSKVFLGRGCSAETQVRGQASCRGALGPPHQGGPCVSETGEDSEGLGGNPLFRRQSPLLWLVSPSRGKLTAVGVVICLSVCLSFWGRVRGVLVTEHRSRRAPLQAGGAVLEDAPTSHRRGVDLGSSLARVLKVSRGAFPPSCTPFTASFLLWPV